MKSTRIMVVEDEQIVGHDIKQRLERMGYEVVGPVASGDEVIEEVEKTTPQLVLMDVYLNSQMDGIQAAEIVRERFSLPVVYLTAYSNEETLERAKRTAPFGFIHKPVADHELRTAVEMALYKHTLENRLRRSESLLSTTLSNLGEAVMTTDARGCLEYLNRAAEHLTGWNADDARGRELAEVLTIADERTFTPLALGADSAVGRLAAARSITNCVLLGREDRKAPVEVSISGLTDEDMSFKGQVILIRDISERERARREIDDLQKQLEFVLGETRTNIDIIDTNFNIRYVDPVWRRFYGDIAGRKCYEYFMDRTDPCPNCGIIRAFETKAITVTEEALAREGNRPIQVTTVPYQDHDGEWLVAELNMDLTERKRTENAMRIQRDLALALAATTMPAEAMDLFLQAALEITGMECGGIYLRNDADGSMELTAAKGLSEKFLDVVRRVPADSPLMNLIAEGVPNYQAYDIIREVLGEPLRNENLRAMAVLPIMHSNLLIGCCNLASREMDELPAYARDGLELMVAQAGNVIKRLQFEQLVGENEARYRHLFDNAPVGYHEIDLQGRLVRVNNTELKMLGYSKEDMIGRHVSDFVMEKDVSREAVKCKLQTGVINDTLYERTYVRRDGSLLAVLVKEYAIYDDKGALQGIRSALQDITEQKQAQAERAQFEERMREVQKLESIGLLAGGIAHDFNNLLMGIQGNTELALMKMPRDSQVFNFLSDIKTACQRAAELTGQLLAYAGKGKYVVEPVNLSVMINEILPLLQTLIGHQAELILELKDDMPPVEGDAEQLRQVVLNLVTNASEALHDRQGFIKIITAVEEIGSGYQPSNYCRNFNMPKGKYCRLTIEDNGCGMDKNILSNLFEPFTTTKFMGRGLGLPAVLGIIRNHGGDIRVTSAPNKGSKFSVLLPLQGAVAPPTPAPTGKKSSQEADKHGCLMLVDDDQAILRVVSRYLEELGFRVLTAVDGEEALALFERHASELRAVILDLTMPRLSGEEVFKRIQERDPSVPVMICSGYSEKETASRFDADSKVGMAFVQKPYELPVLEARLREIMRTL